MDKEELDQNHREVYDKMNMDYMVYACAAMLINDGGTYTHIPADKLRFHKSSDMTGIKELPFIRP